MAETVVVLVSAPEQPGGPPVASPHVNQTKTRLQSLGLLDRALRAMTDEELQAATDALDDDHREALERLIAGEVTPTALREAAARGRIDGTMESIALVVTDAALADCIEQLGEHADNPTTDQLKAVLPGIVERHGVAITRLMLASTVAGEANAAAIIRDLLKRDEVVALPPVEHVRTGPIVRAPTVSPVERDVIKAKRRELRRKKQEDAKTRREQSARARKRD